MLFDTQVTASGMENHAGREEISEALETGCGSSVRHSDTLMEKTMYEARRLYDGSILRISTSQASAGSLMIGMFYPLVLIVIIAIGLSAVLAGRVAKSIVAPLNRLDLERPLSNEAYEEIQPLLRRINQQHLQISGHMDSLKRKTGEFQQIISNMKEGLVLLNSEGTILSINPTAQSLFPGERNHVGRFFLHFERSQQVRDAMNSALDKGYGTARIQRGGRDYELDMIRIESDGMVIGAVVLAFDITESLHASKDAGSFPPMYPMS